MLPAAPQLPSPHTPLPYRRHLRCRCRLPAALWAVARSALRAAASSATVALPPAAAPVVARTISPSARPSSMDSAWRAASVRLARHAPSSHAGMTLLGEVNEAARAAQAAADNSTPCSPSPCAFIQPLIDVLRGAASRATSADAAASSAAPPAGTFDQMQAVREARTSLDTNFRTEPEVLPGQRLPNTDKFALALSPGGPEHRPTIEL
eukprot:3513799-Alexandrium_andersonii.AAC.1